MYGGGSIAMILYEEIKGKVHQFKLLRGYYPNLLLVNKKDKEIIDRWAIAGGYSKEVITFEGMDIIVSEVAAPMVALIVEGSDA